MKELIEDAKTVLCTSLKELRETLCTKDDLKVRGVRPERIKSIEDVDDHPSFTIDTLLEYCIAAGIQLVPVKEAHPADLPLVALSEFQKKALLDADKTVEAHGSVLNKLREMGLIDENNELTEKGLQTKNYHKV